jgi:dTDP-4-dehydrorhamnose reductase
MRILVTGGSGQVGSALAPRLGPIGTVLAPNRGVLDLTELESLPGRLDQLAPDLIVNPAAYTAVDKAEDEPELAMAVNGKAPGVIARWAAARRVPLIHFSTDYVFDGTGERPWREEDRPQPLSVYGATKLAGENEIRSAGGISLIVRTSWVYASAGSNFLRTISRLARDRKELRIVSDQIGAPTSAALLADALGRVVAGGIDNVHRCCEDGQGLAHLAASGETSWHGFACAIIEGLRARGCPLAVESVMAIRTEDYPTKATRPLNSRLDLGRWRMLTGETPPHWRDALAPVLDDLAVELPNARQ